MSPDLAYQLFIISMLVAVIGSTVYIGLRFGEMRMPRSSRYLAFLGSAWVASSLFFTWGVKPTERNEPQLDYLAAFALVLLTIGFVCFLKALPRKTRT